MTSWVPQGIHYVVLVIAVGLCLGSFLNVVIHRLPLDQSLLRPGSRCPSCRTPIRPFHNLPVLGWILLRGRCADCGVSISPRYPLVELTGGGLALLAVYSSPGPLEAISAAWLLFGLTAVFFIDLEHRIIPDEISLGGFVLGLALAHWRIGLVPALSGAAAGAGGLFLAGWIYYRIRGRHGMGMGDVKLGAMLGAFLGLTGIVLTVLIASLLGSILGIALMAGRRGCGSTALPFGSFLAPAAIIAFLWGRQIWAWYLGFFPGG